MTQHTRIHDRFEYHIEDLDCECCLHYKKKRKHCITGCGEKYCRFLDIRCDAIKHNRIERRKGHFSMRHQLHEKRGKLNYE